MKKQLKSSYFRVIVSILVTGLLCFAVGCNRIAAQQTFSPSPLSTKPQETVELLVLMYHSIRKGVESDYSVTPETLESDFQYLQENHYTVISPEALINYVYRGTPLPERPVLLTFDDGFYNNLAYALPLLKEYDFHAVVNIVGEFTEELAPPDSHIPAYSYLTAEDCAALISEGYVTLGNHTAYLHHRGERRGCAKNEDEDEARYHALLSADLTHLQRFLRDTLSVEPYIFAYPYGFYSEESVPVLKDLGFLMTMTCTEHKNQIAAGDPESLYGLGRYNRRGGVSTSDFFHQINS